jgi:hypothetical protein
MGVLAPEFEVGLHLMSLEALGSPERLVHLVPRLRWQELGVLTPEFEVGLLGMSPAAVGSPQRFLHDVPLSWQELEVLASGQRLQLRLVSPSARRP